MTRYWSGLETANPICPEMYFGLTSNLRTEGQSPRTAPSLGAWSLLKWAREYRNRFFEQLLPKVLVVKERRAEEERVADRDVGIDEIKRLLAEVEKDDPYLAAHRLREEIQQLQEENARLKAELERLSKKE